MPSFYESNLSKMMVDGILGVFRHYCWKTEPIVLSIGDFSFIPRRTRQEKLRVQRIRSWIGIRSHKIKLPDFKFDHEWVFPASDLPLLRQDNNQWAYDRVARGYAAYLDRRKVNRAARKSGLILVQRHRLKPVTDAAVDMCRVVYEDIHRYSTCGVCDARTILVDVGPIATQYSVSDDELKFILYQLLGLQPVGEYGDFLALPRWQTRLEELLISIPGLVSTQAYRQAIGDIHEQA